MRNKIISEFEIFSRQLQEVEEKLRLAIEERHDAVLSLLRKSNYKIDQLKTIEKKYYKPLIHQYAHFKDNHDKWLLATILENTGDTIAKPL